MYTYTCTLFLYCRSFFFKFASFYCYIYQQINLYEVGVIMVALGLPDVLLSVTLDYFGQTVIRFFCSTIERNIKDFIPSIACLYHSTMFSACLISKYHSKHLRVGFRQFCDHFKYHSRKIQGCRSCFSCAI